MNMVLYILLTMGDRKHQCKS